MQSRCESSVVKARSGEELLLALSGINGSSLLLRLSDTEPTCITLKPVEALAQATCRRLPFSESRRCASRNASAPKPLHRHIRSTARQRSVDSASTLAAQPWTDENVEARDLASTRRRAHGADLKHTLPPSAPRPLRRLAWLAEENFYSRRAHGNTLRSVSSQVLRANAEC